MDWQIKIFIDIFPPTFMYIIYSCYKYYFSLKIFAFEDSKEQFFSLFHPVRVFIIIVEWDASKVKQNMDVRIKWN